MCKAKRLSFSSTLLEMANTFRLAFSYFVCFSLRAFVSHVLSLLFLSFSLSQTLVDQGNVLPGFISLLTTVDIDIVDISLRSVLFLALSLPPCFLVFLLISPLFVACLFPVGSSSFTWPKTQSKGLLESKSSAEWMLWTSWRTLRVCWRRNRTGQKKKITTLMTTANR
jgi:hypothetical protein